MRYLSILLFFVVCSCQSDTVADKKGTPTAISKTDNVPEVLKEFKALESDSEKQEDYFRSVMKTNFDSGLNVKAMDVFKNVLYNFDSEDYITKLAPIFLYYAKNKEDISSFYRGVQSAFVTKYPQHEYSGKTSDVLTITDLLDQKKELINNPNFNRFSVPDAKDYIDISEGYMLVNPKDKDAGEQLVKAGNMAKSIRGFGPKAVALYDWLLEKQPNHERAPQALFLKAFTYDNEIGDKDRAEALYKDFIAKYPNDDFADDAKLLLENVHKTDEEFYQTIVDKKDKNSK